MAVMSGLVFFKVLTRFQFAYENLSMVSDRPQDIHYHSIFELLRIIKQQSCLAAARLVSWLFGPLTSPAVTMPTKQPEQKVLPNDCPT